jgi:predicted pyridoxine 5'-phosphate oxidase superfamily flavin-nucleotide-binding protein
MNQNFTKLAFTDSVKKLQEQHGSRKSYARMEISGDKYVLTEREISFIKSRDSFYMATVGENGWPYVQYRGGAIGFLKVINGSTLGFADFRGNMQYISTGNINSNGKASLFLMDYPSKQRLKIWAESEVIDADEDSALLKKLEDPNYNANIERLVLFNIKAYDWNCSQHITLRYTTEEIAGEIEKSNPDILKSCCPEDIE